jgi:hypothetical protein
LKGAVKQKVASKLLAAGLAREVKTKMGMAVWRRDEGVGETYSLKLAAAGVRAIAGDGAAAASQKIATSRADANDGPSSACNAASSARARIEAMGTTETTFAAVAGNGEDHGIAVTAPQEGTKIARVLELLRRDGGAKLDEVVTATGWLPHTSRAALTGLRKRGYEIERRPGTEGGSVYAIGVATRA